MLYIKFRHNLINTILKYDTCYKFLFLILEIHILHVIYYLSKNYFSIILIFVTYDPFRNILLISKCQILLIFNIF